MTLQSQYRAIQICEREALRQQEISNDTWFINKPLGSTSISYWADLNEMRSKEWPFFSKVQKGNNSLCFFQIHTWFTFIVVSWEAHVMFKALYQYKPVVPEVP